MFKFNFALDDLEDMEPLDDALQPMHGNTSTDSASVVSPTAPLKPFGQHSLNDLVGLEIIAVAHPPDNIPTLT